MHPNAFGTAPGPRRQNHRSPLDRARRCGIPELLTLAQESSECLNLERGALQGLIAELQLKLANAQQSNGLEGTRSGRCQDAHDTVDPQSMFSSRAAGQSASEAGAAYGDPALCRQALCELQAWRQRCRLAMSITEGLINGLQNVNSRAELGTSQLLSSSAACGVQIRDRCQSRDEAGALCKKIRECMQESRIVCKNARIAGARAVRLVAVTHFDHGEPQATGEREKDGMDICLDTCRTSSNPAVARTERKVGPARPVSKSPAPPSRPVRLPLGPTQAWVNSSVETNADALSGKSPVGERAQFKNVAVCDEGMSHREPLAAVTRCNFPLHETLQQVQASTADLLAKYSFKEVASQENIVSWMGKEDWIANLSHESLNKVEGPLEDCRLDSPHRSNLSAEYDKTLQNQVPKMCKLILD